MKIDVIEANEWPLLKLEFVKYGFGKRLWIQDPSEPWYKTVGKFCPHLDLGAGECRDCSLLLDTDEEWDGQL